jgi:hypothetical protein
MAIRSFSDVGTFLQRIEVKQERVLRGLKEELQSVRRKIGELETTLAAVDTEPRMPTGKYIQDMFSEVDEAAYQAITSRIFTLMRRDPTYVTRTDLDALTCTEGDSNLTQCVDDLEKDMYHTAGSVPQALERMEHLETAQAATAIELGGYVFTDDGAVDVWLRSLNDLNINWFCVDFLILSCLMPHSKALTTMETIFGSRRQSQE